MCTCIDIYHVCILTDLNAPAAGDVKAAEEFLRKKGLSSAGKKAGRTAADGAIGAYVHLGSQCAALLVVSSVRC